MQSLVLQDWTTIRGASTISSIVQAEADWLDMAPFQDVVAWLHVVEVSNTVTLAYETAPSKDEAFFTNVTGSTIALAAGSVNGTLTVTPMLMTLVPNPVARFLRWRLSGSGGLWDATFRILIAANPPTQ